MSKLWKALIMEKDWLQTVLLTYYAKNVAKINDHIYYYDRTNIDSYVSKIPHDTELWNQSLKTAFIVDHFFLTENLNVKN